MAASKISGIVDDSINMQHQNPGFEATEIQGLKQLCTEAKRSFIYIDDDTLPVGDEKEMAHIQFVGHFQGQEVIYDAIICTLQLHYSSLIYEAAEREAVKHFPLYVPLENRDEHHQENESLDEEVEMMILEIIEEMEENDDLRVSEYLELDTEFDFGIGLEAALYVPSLEPEVLDRFITQFNSGAFQLDPTMYSFKSE